MNAWTDHNVWIVAATLGGGLLVIALIALYDAGISKHRKDKP